MNRKGSVASTFEIAFGVLIVMFIFISSIYFSQIGEVKSNADVVAVNSGFECYNNLNNILKTDKIFNEKTSIILGKSDDNASNLMTIVNYFENLNSDFKLINESGIPKKEWVEAKDQDFVSKSQAAVSSSPSTAPVPYPLK